ncbi:MAG: hypothetical protein ACRC7O_07775 [Fimbriiglobus sp.]
MNQPWLVSYDKAIGQHQAIRHLESLGCETGSDTAPIPLGATEEAIAVTGPDDLPRRLGNGTVAGMAAFPNSTQEPFR